MTRAGTVLAAALVLAAGCSAPATARPRPPSAPTLDVTLHDFRFEHAPTVAGGRTVFRIRNAGSVAHTLTLTPLPDDFTLPVGALFEPQNRRTFGVTAQLFPHEPGTTGTFAVDLRAGRYMIVCFLETGGGGRHHERGMLSELRVA